MQRFIIRKIKEVDYKFDRIWVIIGQVYAGYAVFLDNRSVSNFVQFLFRIYVPCIYLYICFKINFEVFRARVYNRFVDIIGIVAADDSYVGIVSINAKT